MKVEQRMRVKVLWLANWSAREISQFAGLPIEEVEELTKVFIERKENLNH